MNNVLISIIVPCYNQAQYLDECLQSVIDQTYKKWECIIVNDGSPDNTEEVAQKWTKIDSRFKYIAKENGGVASARNFGINNAFGEWILPLDADDKIGIRYLELAASEFENGYSLIYSKAHYFNDNYIERWNIRDFNFEHLLLFNHIYCSAFFRKKDWETKGGYDINLIYGVEDWEFWISLLDRNCKVKILNYDGFFYRVKRESRNTDFFKSNFQKKVTDTYIYKKHLNKYLDHSDDPIENYREILKNNRDLKRINKEIRKNFLTRFLYKIIEILNNVKL
jgi:glycosyltransferase involved in cell wall biosynthesis